MQDKSTVGACSIVQEYLEKWREYVKEEKQQTIKKIQEMKNSSINRIKEKHLQKPKTQPDRKERKIQKPKVKEPQKEEESQIIPMQIEKAQRISSTSTPKEKRPKKPQNKEAPAEDETEIRDSKVKKRKKEKQPTEQNISIITDRTEPPSTNKAETISPTKQPEEKNRSTLDRKAKLKAAKTQKETEQPKTHKTTAPAKTAREKVKVAKTPEGTHKGTAKPHKGTEPIPSTEATEPVEIAQISPLSLFEKMHPVATGIGQDSLVLKITTPETTIKKTDKTDKTEEEILPISTVKDVKEKIELLFKEKTKESENKEKSTLNTPTVEKEAKKEKREKNQALLSGEPESITVKTKDLVENIKKEEEPKESARIIYQKTSTPEPEKALSKPEKSVSMKSIYIKEPLRPSVITNVPAANKKTPAPEIKKEPTQKGQTRINKPRERPYDELSSINNMNTSSTVSSITAVENRPTGTPAEILSKISQEKIKTEEPDRIHKEGEIKTQNKKQSNESTVQEIEKPSKNIHLSSTLSMGHSVEETKIDGIKDREKKSFERLLPARHAINKPDTTQPDTDKKEATAPRIVRKIDRPNQSFVGLNPTELKEKTVELNHLLKSLKSKVHKKEETKEETEKKKEPAFSPVMDSSDDEIRDQKFNKKKWVDSPSLPRRILMQNEDQAEQIFGLAVNTKVNLKEMFGSMTNVSSDSPTKMP